ncbi:MAG: hypothetical protein COA69_12605 [Robiginitomaculum sp.]|nr:MAG: hypothetical protein COA69_12605 [Robiginitomaculum sp.]
MDEQELRAAGTTFLVGEDLYGISIDQLQERTNILNAEIERISIALHKKNEELTVAENFFNNS